MLSIGRLARGQEGYYLAAVACGVEDYYVGPGEAPGMWIGGGAGDLGLAGEVSGEDLVAVLGGNDPVSNEPIGRPGRKVPGFDLTFSAPKSVSLLNALGDDTMRAAAVAAHRSATVAALGHLEREVCFVRRGRNGVDRLETSGFVGAAFEHRTSRAGDPQLHTHVLVANAAHGRDGGWGTLDSRALYRHARTAGFLYQAHLRFELTRSLGVKWCAVRNGMAELAGIAPKVLRAFSQRRQEIETAMAARGESSAAAAEIATLDTRAVKDRTIDPAALADIWRGRAIGFGLDHRALRALCGRITDHVLATCDDEQVGRALTHHDATFGRPKVLREFASSATQGMEVRQIEEYATRFLGSPIAVRIADRGDARYSTPEMLATETALLDGVARRRDASVAVVGAEEVVAAIEDRPHLSDDQHEMIERLCRSGCGIEAALGPPGSGKTAALDAARAAWRTAGIPVLGVALSAKAAAELEAGSGIRSATVAALLHELAQPHATGLPAGCVVVVDEAAMVGTRAMHQLAQHAEAAAAKLVLVGDPRQLPAIEAGGAFAAIVKRFGAVELTGNHRQQDRVERAALTQLRTGRVDQALSILRGSDRVIEASDAGTVRQQLVADWHAATLRGEQAVMLTVRRHDVDDLNTSARKLLVANGKLHGPQLEVSDKTFAAGDVVVACRNRRSLGITNGDRGTITSVDGATGEVMVELDRGPLICLPSGYLRDGHLAHGYAMTIHKAQGMTCDVALLLGNDTLFREAGYTGLSRGRHENRLYVVAPDMPDHDAVRAMQERNPTEALIGALRRSQAKALALDSGIDRIDAPR